MGILDKIIQFFQEIREAVRREPPLGARWKEKDYDEPGEQRPT